MEVRFTRHALEKFSVLKRHGILLSKDTVSRAVLSPESTDESRLPLLIAQRALDTRRVLRVVYKIINNTAVIITFYPGRKSQYEKK